MTQPANTPLLALDIRPVVDPADRGYVRFTWVESSHGSPRHHNIPWPIYKQSVGKQIASLIDRSDVNLLGAYEPGGFVVGWLAYTPGRVSTVHYVATRADLKGEAMRHRGVATALLKAAELGKRIVYTFQGTRRHRNLPPMDVALIEWARAQGVTATHVPLNEWLR